jgi:hypothetical protein
MDRIRELIVKIRKSHNAEFDIRPGGPTVTWAEAELADALGDLLVKVEKIEYKVEHENLNLLNRIGFLESKLIGFIKYGSRLPKGND